MLTTAILWAIQSGVRIKDDPPIGLYIEVCSVTFSISSMIHPDPSRVNRSERISTLSIASVICCCMSRLFNIMAGTDLKYEVVDAIPSGAGRTYLQSIARYHRMGLQIENFLSTTSFGV